MDVYRSKKVLFDDRGSVGPGRIYVLNGKIMKVMDGYDLPENDELDVLVDHDFDTDVIMPGLVDSGCHANDPGRSEWEGFKQVTHAAAAGGFTSIIDLPVFTVPPTTSVETLFRKINATRGKSYVDVGFFGGITANNIKNVRSLVKSGVAGFKCYLSDTGVNGFKKVDGNTIEAILKEMRNSDSILHVEANFTDRDLEPEGDASEYKTYLDTKTEAAEHAAINTVIEALRHTGAEVKCHINNLSSGSACEILKEAQNDELPLTVDTACYYLALNQNMIQNGATEFKTNPPIRDEINQELLWDGIKEGVIQNVNTNHLALPPQVAKTDRGDFFKARAGIDSLQFALPLIWTYGWEQGINMDECHRLLARGPALAVGLDHRKGCMEPGFDADFVVWDPKQEFTVTEEMLIHNNKHSPYLGMKLKGVVKQTIVRGTTVYEAGRIVCMKPPGRVLLAGELGDEVGRFGDVVPGGPQIKRRLSLTPAMISTAFVPGEEVQYKMTRRMSYYK